MPPYRARALVLRKTKLGETDVILTLLAQDGSQLRAVAKGMRKPGSRFGGRLEPFSVVDLLLHTGRSLDVVTEADSHTAHAVLREDFDRTAAASVVADLLDKLSCQGQAEERLFGLACATLDAMGSASADSLTLLVTGFLVKAMAMHGLRPELDSCAACACEPQGGHRFSLEAGGILCPECGERDGASLAFGEDGRVLLLRLLGTTMAQIAESAEDPAVVGECFALMRGFVNYHIPARLKALDFYAGVAR